MWMEYQNWRVGAVEGPCLGLLISLHLIFVFLAPNYALCPTRQVALGKTLPCLELSTRVLSWRRLRPWDSLWLHSPPLSPPSLEAQNQMPLDRALGRSEAGWARPLGLPCWAADAATSTEWPERAQTAPGRDGPARREQGRAFCGHLPELQPLSCFSTGHIHLGIRAVTSSLPPATRLGVLGGFVAVRVNYIVC